MDVGGGASILGSRLLAEGFSDVTVLDIAASALAVARDEVGFTGNIVVADVREWRPERRYRVWHDRAVFHFLTTPEDRAAYRRTLDAAVEPDGWGLSEPSLPTAPSSVRDFRLFATTRPRSPPSSWVVRHGRPAGGTPHSLGCRAAVHVASAAACFP